MNRRTALALTAAAVAGPSVAGAQTLIPLHIAGVPEDSITPAVWATQNGIFRKHGLDVQLEAQHSGSAVTAGVAGGSYQFGKSSMISMLVAHAHNIPVVIVAPGGLYQASDANEAIIVKSDSPIRTGADLNGKIVACSAINDLYMIGTRAWADAHGGDSSTIKFVELPISAVAAALDTGRIDAGATIDPDLQQALNTGQSARPARSQRRDRTAFHVYWMDGNYRLRARERIDGREIPGGADRIGALRQRAFPADV